MPSAASERTIRKAHERQAKDQAIERSVVQALMSTHQGRRWVWLNLERAGVFLDDPGSDPLVLAR